MKHQKTKYCKYFKKERKRSFVNFSFEPWVDFIVQKKSLFFLFFQTIFFSFFLVQFNDFPSVIFYDQSNFHRLLSSHKLKPFSRLKKWKEILNFKLPGKSHYMITYYNPGICDHINWTIAMNDGFCLIIFNKTLKSDYYKRQITLIVITLSCFHFIKTNVFDPSANGDNEWDEILVLCFGFECFFTDKNLSSHQSQT